MKEPKVTWKHNYGDNEPTYDWVMWIGKEPTENTISQYSGVYVYYVDGVETGMEDSLKEAKESILKELNLIY